ncbi:FkbM family methyltransferase [Synechococcus sp. WH 8016]|uniref:FkbM family methyltransferase n=1 Tax=Synechococcus sp. WH 8016 TaxID=166318 RepID=UPI00022D9C7E|nr:FkbM family methyltransferase [Synechococcus sp. WH 8016]EHA62379.1 methyltransferase FkbM family [Synechococcus sp. WH 8016]
MKFLYLVELKTILAKIARKVNRLSSFIFGATIWSAILKTECGFKLYNNIQENDYLPSSALNFMIGLNRYAERAALYKQGAFIKTKCNGNIVRLPILSNKSHWQFFQSYRWHDPFYAELICIVLETEQRGVFIDVGANQGLRSIDPLDIGWEVHAIEPNKEKIHFLSEIYSINEFNESSSLSIHACCAGPAKGRTELHIDESSYLSQVTQCLDGSFESTHKILCDMNTVADIIRDCEIKPSRVVAKIDTEGFEIEVIKGINDYLSQFKALFVELNPRNTSLFLELTKSAEECLWIDNKNYKLVDLRKKPPMHQVDVIVINRLSAMTLSKLEQFSEKRKP